MRALMGCLDLSDQTHGLFENNTAHSSLFGYFFDEVDTCNRLSVSLIAYVSIKKIGLILLSFFVSDVYGLEN